jgi:LmbE family N-acetylglucosaminyl deacetylase/galactose-1-phosphate uridylyltransferase
LEVANGRPSFVIKVLETTPAFDKNTHKWSPQTITCVPDPLGINGETQIGKLRAERPRSEAPPPPSARFDEDTFKSLFPIFAHPQNDWLLSSLVEGTENGRILGWIYNQLDQIPILSELDRKRVDSLRKQILLNPAVPPEILFTTCIFCNVKGEQVQDSMPREQSVFSIHNDFPFAPIMHKVLILKERKHDIAEITANEISYFYEMLYRVVKEAKEKFGKSLDGITYGMNYGLPRIVKGRSVIASGASQPHLHSQVAGLGADSFNAADRIGIMCNAYRRKYRRDYLEDYLTALRDANLIVEENDEAVLFVPIAQRFNYELQIMVKKRGLGNILRTFPRIRRAIGELEHLAYMLYQHDELGIQSFNTVMYATRFSGKPNLYQRLIVSIYPRTSILALSELAHRSVVDSYPWVAAARLRGIRDEVRNRPRQLVALVITAHPDDLELGAGGFISELIKRQHHVHSLVVTDGCGGTGRSPELRQHETNAAAKSLGLATVNFGLIRDSQAHAGDTLYGLIDAQIKRHKPDFIITHASVNTEHTDHKNISEAVKTVCARQKLAIYPLMLEVPVYTLDESFHPSVYVKLDFPAVEKKLAAIKEHKSELKRKTIDLDKVRQRAELRAREIGTGVQFAEAFSFEGPTEVRIQLAAWLPFLIFV